MCIDERNLKGPTAVDAVAGLLDDCIDESNPVRTVDMSSIRSIRRTGVRWLVLLDRTPSSSSTLISHLSHLDRIDSHSHLPLLPIALRLAHKRGEVPSMARIKVIAGVALSSPLGVPPRKQQPCLFPMQRRHHRMYTMRLTTLSQAAVEAQSCLPMNVSADSASLAAVRSKPHYAVSYSIDRATRALKLVAKGMLVESLPYICSDKTGRWLLGASYGGHKVTVNPIGKDGKVGKESQVIPTALNAHAILTDQSNKYAFVPHLGTDQVFQFRFDARPASLIE